MEEKIDRIEQKVNDIDGRLIKQEIEHKVVSEKVDKMEEIVGSIKDLTYSINDIVKNQTSMVEEMKEIKNKVLEIEKEPIEDYKDYKKTIIKQILTFVISAILGFLASKFVL